MVDTNGAVTTAAPIPGHRMPDQAVFRHVVGHFASGVTVLTTVHDGKLYGTTASAVSSLSMEPPMMLACLNRSSSTHAAIAAAGVFGISILSDGQGDLAYKFGRSAADKFEDVALSYSEEGIPLLEGSLATMVCTVAETATGGTHTVFLGEVLEAVANPGLPLTYYRGKFGRFEGGVEHIAYDGTRTWVLHRTTPLGVPLPIEEIAGSLRVDPAAVENALIKLTSESLVERDSQGRYLASPLTADLTDSLYDARAAIEIGVINGRLDDITDEVVDDLEELTAKMANIRETSEATIGDFLKLHVAFHDRLVGVTGSSQLVDSFRRLGIGTVWRTALAPDEWAQQMDHEPLVRVTRALRAHDVTAAVAAVTAEYDFSKALAHTVIERHGGRV